MDAVNSYSAMERSDLESLKASKEELLRSAQHEIRKLKKKFKSGHYDRQIICEYILSFQNQTAALIASIKGINEILEGQLAAA